MSTMRDENVLMGKRITSAREDRGWSKADLARKAGVAPSYITRIEQGKFDRPSVDLVRAIADALRIGVSDLLGPGQPDVQTAADLQAALMARGFRADEAPLVDTLAGRLLELPPRQRRQLLGLLDNAIEIAAQSDDPAQ